MRIGLSRPRTRVVAAACLVFAAAAACTEKTPSGLDDRQLPDPPVTVTFQLNWADFGSNLQVHGGFGTTDHTGSSILARAYGGVESRTLLSFGPFPSSAQVYNASNTLTTDTALTFIDAYVLARFDTLASTNTDTVTLALSQTLETWEPSSVSWNYARNLPTNQVAWSAPGGGAVVPMRTRSWVRADGDSVTLFLDSAQVANWRAGNDSVRSARIDLLSDGHRLRMVYAAVRLVATSAVDPDTTLEFTLPTTRVAYIYDPLATPPADGFRIGGTPSWRTVLDVNLPSVLNGPPALCAAAGCPFTLEPRNISYAGLALTSRKPPDAFTPTDSIRFDVRAVLSPGALPKAPLSASLAAAGGTAVAPDVFGVSAGALVDIPITAFIQSFLAGPDATGRSPSNMLAILTTPEPQSFSFAEFFGPGGPNEPVLKLTVTVSPPMELP